MNGTNTTPEVPDSGKRLVRAVLFSEWGVPLDEFGKDYKQLEGKVFPYRSYGFSNLRECLESIPDVVRFEFSQEASRWILYAVADETSFMSSFTKKKILSNTNAGLPNKRRGGRNRSRDNSKVQNSSAERNDTDGPLLVRSHRGLFTILIRCKDVTFDIEEVADLIRSTAPIAEHNMYQSLLFFRYKEKDDAEAVIAKFNGFNFKDSKLSVKPAEEKVPANGNQRKQVNGVIPHMYPGMHAMPSLLTSPHVPPIQYTGLPLGVPFASPHMVPYMYDPYMSQVQMPMTSRMNTPMIPHVSTPVLTCVNTPSVTPHMNTPSVTPHMNTPSVTPHMYTPSVTPHMNTPSVTPHMNTPMIPHMSTPVLTCVNTPSVTPHMNTPMASSVSTPVTSLVNPPMTSEVMTSSTEVESFPPPLLDDDSEDEDWGVSSGEDGPPPLVDDPDSDGWSDTGEENHQPFILTGDTYNAMANGHLRQSMETKMGQSQLTKTPPGRGRGLLSFQHP